MTTYLCSAVSVSPLANQWSVRPLNLSSNAVVASSVCPWLCTASLSRIIMAFLLPNWWTSQIVSFRRRPSSQLCWQRALTQGGIWGQMLKCHSWCVSQQEQVLLGLLVNGVGVLGGGGGLVPRASGSAPALWETHHPAASVSKHNVRLQVVLRLLMMLSDSPAADWRFYLFPLKTQLWLCGNYL